MRAAMGGGAGRVRTAASQFCSLPDGSTTGDDQQRQKEKTNQEINNLWRFHCALPTLTRIPNREQNREWNREQNRDQSLYVAATVSKDRTPPRPFEPLS